MHHVSSRQIRRRRFPFGRLVVAFTSTVVAFVVVAAHPTASASDEAEPVPPPAERGGDGGLSPARFEDPPGSSRPTMLWFWNGTVTEDLVDEQLAEMRREGIFETIIFPDATSDLKPVFFSEDWFDIVDHTLREARDHGMKVWLFNDRRFPSGYAAGIVANGGTVGDRTYLPRPDLRAQSLARTKVSVTGPGEIDLRAEFPGLVPAALTVADGRLHVDQGNVTVLNHGLDWTDYTVSLDTRPLDTASQNGNDYAQAGWVVRAQQDGQNGYVYLLNNYPHSGSDGGTLTRLVYRDGRNTDVTHIPLPFDVVAGRSYHVETRVEGDRMVTSVDGVEVDEFTSDVFAAGTVGLREWTSTQESATFDNIEVTAPDGSVLYSQSFDSEAALNDFTQPAPPEDVVGVAALPVAAEGPSYKGLMDLTGRFRRGEVWQAPRGDYVLEYYVRHVASDVAAGYLNLLDRDAVDAYIGVIHDEYYRRFGWAFDSGLIPGFWDDEPRLPAGSRGPEPPWSDTVGELIEGAGSSPGRVLAAVFGDYGQIGERDRGTFYRAVGDAFAEAYYRPQGEWATEHNTRFISNPWGDGWMPTQMYSQSGEIFKNNQWAQIPGGDAIFDYIVPGRRSLLPRHTASAGHQFGASRILHENLGGYGWEVTPQLARYVNGAMGVRGVDLTVLHAYWTNPDFIRYPPPLQPSNPWWDTMGDLTTWTGRVMELVRGTAMAPTALLHPQTAAQAAQGTSTGSQLDDAYGRVAYAMEDVQVDYDLLDEASLNGDSAMRFQARARDGALRIGPQAYRVVVIPTTPMISLEAVERLERLVRGGGTVIAYGDLPNRETEGRDSALQAALGRLFETHDAGAGRAVVVDDLAGLTATLRSVDAPAARLTPAAPEVRVLRVRHGSDWVWLFMNEDTEPVSTVARLPIGGTPELWDPDDGSHRVAAEFYATGGGKSTAVPLDLEPTEVVGVVFRGGGARPAAHLLRSPLSVEEVTGSELGLAAEVLADRAGSFSFLGLAGGRRYAGTADVAGDFSPIALDGDWRFRFDAPGGEWTSRPLGSWTEVDPEYSGRATYAKDFEISDADLATGRRLVLDLGKVRDAARVTVNGQDLGWLPWEPYRIDVTDALRAGQNTVEVGVANTPANQHGDALESGLLGPVVLRRQQELTVQLDRPVGDQGELVDIAVHPLQARLLPCQEVELGVTVTNHSYEPLTSALTATAQGGVTVSPGSTPVRLGGRDSVTLPVTVSAPTDAAPGDYSVDLSVGGRDMSVAVRVDELVDLADAGTASASSTHSAFRPAGAIDGNHNGDDWPNTGWNDGTAGVFPDTFTVDLACPSQVSRVELWTLDSSRYPASRYGLRDYDVQVHAEGTWQTVDTVTGSTAGHHTSVFPSVTADAVRVVVTGSNDGSYSRIVELDVLRD